MSVCPGCGAHIEPGQFRCSTCRRPAWPRPPDRGDTSPEQIKRKIAQMTFARNDLRRWTVGGGLAGLAVGFMAGLVDAFMRDLPVPEGAMACAVLGGFGGLLAGLSVPAVRKPIWTAIFHDTARFEREYGDKPVGPPP
jgi:hypothetical protein